MEKRKGIFFAVLAAALYAVNAPCAKLLLASVQPTMMAAFLYLGAGAGMGVISLAGGKKQKEPPLTRKELPYTIGMILLDILAPVLLMLGLGTTAAANVSLLNNFEIVATALIALAVFHERVSPRLWAAIGLVTLASILLSFEGEGSLSFSAGSLYVLGACLCWGLENNCTRMLSGKSPMQGVSLKGFGSGTGALALALLVGESLPGVGSIALTMLLGVVAYGLSIFFYVYAQRYLGAAKTSAYYALAPFIGVLLSLILFRQLPGALFYAALAVMAAGAYLASTDG